MVIDVHGAPVSVRNQLISWRYSLGVSSSRGIFLSSWICLSSVLSIWSTVKRRDLLCLVSLCIVDLDYCS